MAKSRTERASASVWSRRCFTCWAAPLIFLFLVPYNMPLNGTEFGMLETLGPPLMGLTATSLLGITLPLCGCASRWLVVVQVVLQIVIIGCFLAPEGTRARTTSEVGPAGPAAAEPKRAEASKAKGVAARFLEPRATSGPGTMSVVLPCLNEPYAFKTVMSFCNRTPPEVLEEIIVVDDASVPHLITKLEGVPPHCKMKVLRHNESLGLMIAKQTGGDAAAGTYIGFYDCHVAPAKNWYKETIELLAAKERRLVVPMIADLDLDSWDEKVHGALTAKCYINFNADFWWYEDQSDFIPVISGGLVATTQKWWKDSGGFDPGMRGWGGENTDQSLRAWLCGGDILRAKSSHVAHMWRVDSDARTLSHYKLKHRTDNLARVAAIWFGEFKDKFREGKLDSKIDVSIAARKLQDLQCKPFAYFLHRFRKLYVAGGVLPEYVFHLRLKGTEKCISKAGGNFRLENCATASWLHFANMAPPGFPTPSDFQSTDPDSASSSEVVCGGHTAPNCAECPRQHGQDWCHVDCKWLFGHCVPAKSRFAPSADANTGNLSRSSWKFSGIRLWNSIECFDRLDPTGPIVYFCDITGQNQNQQYLLDAKGLIRHASGRCVSVNAKPTQLAAVPCKGAREWEVIEQFVPSETQRYEAAVARHQLGEDLPDS
ncbi:gly-6 [Symbiodinium sp. CCMP2592]|nr:gly-6 [Symbiodinium sp. CCMP2592]